MIYVFVAAGLFFILLCLLSGSVRACFCWNRGGFTLSIGYLNFSFQLYPGGWSRSSGKTGGEKAKDGGSIIGSLPWLKLAPELSRVSKRLVNLLVKYGRITNLRLRGSVGTDDPYSTGVYAGLAQVLKGNLEGCIPSVDINVYPDFRGRNSDITGEGRFEIRLASLIFISIIFLWSLPKWRIWSLIRNR